jgi:tetratricopeptide (TPR) repeat protein
MYRNRFTAHSRALPMLLLGSLLLSGCNSFSGSSTHGIEAALGVDSHGQPIGAAWPSIPHSNQVSLKGDQSRRYVQLGKENFYNDNFGVAERYFRKAVEIRPDSDAAWAGLAASYDQLGRFDLADRAYDQLIKLRANDARVLNNRGYSFLLRGDYAKADHYFQKARAADPALTEVEGNLQLLAEFRTG